MGKAEVWIKVFRRYLASLSRSPPIIKSVEAVSQTKESRKVPEKRDENKFLNLILSEQFKLHNLNTGPSPHLILSQYEARQYYTQMQSIRRLEQMAASLYREQVIRGFCHLYSGQEAVCVGIKAALRPTDEVITAYRCHGWAYVMGVSPAGILMELAGCKDGVMRGKGGSMHIFAPYFYGGNGIVGSNVPLGAGIALACKYKSKGSVVFALYGDGAANQGQLYEAYNMASLWQLPIVFCCENNRFGMGTSIERASGDTELYKRGNHLPGIWVDGMNVLAVKNAAKFARDYAQKKGPLILEFDTYRYYGHSMSDPGTSYRKRKEIEMVRKQRDPIENFVFTCVEYGLLSDDDCGYINEEIRKEMLAIRDAIAQAKPPAPQEIATDVYAHCLEEKIRSTTGYNLVHQRLNCTFQDYMLKIQ